MSIQKSDEQDESSIAKRGVLLGNLFIFFSSFGMTLTMPFLQARRDELGCDALCYGSMTSARSALGLLGSLMIGRLSDRTGRRPMLCLGLLGTLVSLSVAIVMPSLFGMWLALVPSALLNQNFSIMKALFSDYYAGGSSTAEADRAGAIGQMSMAMGVSMMVGSGGGSKVASDYRSAQIIGFVISFASATLITLLPTPLTCTTATPSASKGGCCSSLRKLASLPVLRTPGARLLIGVRISMALAFWLFYSVLTPSLKNRFDFGPAQHGQLMAFVGFVYAISQGIVAKPLIKVFASHGDVSVLLSGCMAWLGIGRVFAMLTSDVRIFYCSFGLVITALGVTNTLISSAAALIAGESAQTGGLYGVLEACESAAGMAGPALGGLLARVAESYGPQHLVLGVVVTLYIVNAVAVALWYGHYVVPPKSNNEAAHKKMS